MKHIHVGVCVPSGGEWVDEFCKSLALMCSYFAQNRVEDCDCQRLSILTARGSMLVDLRHRLTGMAVKAGCTHILYLDSDMSFPKDTLNKMLKEGMPVLLLNCTTRNDPPQPTAFDVDQERLDSRGKVGVQRVSHGGMAVMLVETEVVKRLTPPLFMMDWIPDMKAYCGEDVYF